MAKQENKCKSFILKILPNEKWAWFFTIFGLLGGFGALWFEDKFNPENHEARIETDANGTKLLKWYAKNNQTHLITPNPTLIHTIVITPIIIGKVDQEYQQSDLEEKYDLAVKAVNRGDWQKAENYLLAYVAIDPNRQTSFYLLGYVQID